VDFALLFTLGLAGSAHCLGMCGGFVVAVTAGGRERARRVVLYHTGKLATYVFLGAIAGHLGRAAGELGLGQRALALVSGSVLLLMGVESLGLLHRFMPRVGEAIQLARRAVFSPLLSLHGGSSSFVVGIMNGFLPCGLVYAALAAAAARGSAGQAMLGMAVFGLGTWPALGALGFAGSALGPGVRARLRPAAAVLMLALAGVSFWRAAVSPAAPCHEISAALANLRLGLG
jgi:hypothetical protein